MTINKVSLDGPYLLNVMANGVVIWHSVTLKSISWMLALLGGSYSVIKCLGLCWNMFQNQSDTLNHVFDHFFPYGNHVTFKTRNTVVVFQHNLSVWHPDRKLQSCSELSQSVLLKLRWPLSSGLSPSLSGTDRDSAGNQPQTGTTPPPLGYCRNKKHQWGKGPLGNTHRCPGHKYLTEWWHATSRLVHVTECASCIWSPEPEGGADSRTLTDWLTCREQLNGATQGAVSSPVPKPGCVFTHLQEDEVTVK